MTNEKLIVDLYEIKEALRLIALKAHRKSYVSVNDVFSGYKQNPIPENISEGVQNAIEKYSTKIGSYLINSVQDTHEIYNEFCKLYSTDNIKSVNHADKIIDEQISIQYNKYMD